MIKNHYFSADTMMMMLQRCYYKKLLMGKTNVKESSSLLSSSLSPILNDFQKKNSAVRDEIIFPTTGISSWSFSTTTKTQEKDVVVQGVWVFHRHGDRTPSRSLVPPHMYEEEASYWRTKIPQPAKEYHEAFNHFFPITYVDDSDGGHKNNDKPTKEKRTFIDGKKEPYGFLTFRGMDQMKQVGCDLLQRYHKHPDMNKSNGVAESPFYDYWNVRAFSTDYLRTVKSVQCLLDGLINNTQSCNNNDTNNSFEDMSAQEYLEKQNEIFDFSNETHRSNHRKHDIKVEIRDRKVDSLNAFDRDASLMKSLVTRVANTDYFRAGDVKAAPLAARLANYLPGLADSKGRNNFGGPSGINWIHASDHFVCRSSHNLPYSAYSNNDRPYANTFSDRDNHTEKTCDDGFIEGENEQILAAMSHQTISHLAWRFHQWYTSAPLLAEIAAPPLREIMNHIQNSITSLTSMDTEVGHSNIVEGITEEKQNKKPFVIYSCHDVTILSLLYAVQAEFLTSTTPNQDGHVDDYDENSQSKNTYWPPYASTLIFELIQVDTTLKNTHIQKTYDDSDLYKIRILLNGKIIGIKNCRKSIDNDSELDSFIPISVLDDVIRNLEEKRTQSS